jgi:hypothetical protein
MSAQIQILNMVVFRHKHKKVGLIFKKNFIMETPIVTTLTLCSQPKQGLIKVWGKSEAQESHFMLPGV